MAEGAVNPLIDLLEQHRAELARLMLEANTTTTQRLYAGSEGIAQGLAHTNHVLDAVIAWLRDHNVPPESILIAMQAQSEPGVEVTPQEALARVDRTLGLIADFMRNKLGGVAGANAARQILSGAAVARMMIAKEVLKRVGE